MLCFSAFLIGRVGATGDFCLPLLISSTLFQRAGAEVDAVYVAERCTHVISDGAASELPGGSDEVVQVRLLFRLAKTGAHWEGRATSGKASSISVCSGSPIWCAQAPFLSEVEKLVPRPPHVNLGRVGQTK